jgi:hypothetical protein
MAWFKLVPGAWFKALQWSGAEGTWAAQKEAKAEINRPSLALFAWGSKVKGSFAVERRVFNLHLVSCRISVSFPHDSLSTIG